MITAEQANKKTKDTKLYKIGIMIEEACNQEKFFIELPRIKDQYILDTLKENGFKVVHFNGLMNKTTKICWGEGVKEIWKQD